jgi:Arc/MetJ family transcription regulator
VLSSRWHNWFRTIRITIEIDDKLMAKAMKAAGRSTKKETVHEALELLVRIRDSQRTMQKLRGKVQWEGDLDAMRRAGAPVHWPEHDKE